jgi:BON domain-containing protein
MGFLSREIVRRAAPLVMAGAAGAAGAAVIARRRMSERRRLSLVSGPPQPVPPQPAPTPVPDPSPAPTPPPEPEPPVAAEADLERTVRDAIASQLDAAGGNVDVEVAGRMVVLRGRVDSPESIRELERAAATTPGVEGVRVLLHLPGRMAKRR